MRDRLAPDKRDSCTRFPRHFLQAIGIAGAGQMFRVTNHDAVHQELGLSFDKAIQRFPDSADQLDELFEVANDVLNSIRVLEMCVDSMDVNLAFEASDKFMWVANRFFSLNERTKALFTWRDTQIRWRSGAARNIVFAIEYEADHYHILLDPILNNSSSTEKALFDLQSLVRERTGRDDDTKIVGVDSTEPAERAIIKPREIRWSDYRQPKEWRRLRRLKGLSGSVNVWAHLCRENPDDIQCESTKSGRISFELNELWGLDLPEFRK